MAIDRRRLIVCAGATVAATPAFAQQRTPSRPPLTSALGLDAGEFGVKPNSDADQSAALQRAVDKAAETRAPLALAPGHYRAAGLMLPAGANIRAARGSVRIRAADERPIASARAADGVTLDGLILDGGGRKLPDGAGLVTLQNGERVRVVDCDIIESGGNGLRLEGIGGEIATTSIAGIADVAILSFDGRGLTIRDNQIRDAGNNGIQIIRNAIGDDGTLVLDNRIANVGNRSGGSGQFGNGVNAFRAGNVIVRGNQISSCAFSAVRGNSSSNIQIVGNTCSDLGEVALYAEFAFAGAVIAGNTVERAQTGISVTNFNEGGRLAVVQGNIVRDLVPRRPGTDDVCTGISVEADTAVTGNVVERAVAVGILAGWGKYLRDVTISGNVVRAAAIGIGFSVVDGAGAAVISANIIAGSRRGAIMGMDHHKPATGDLAVAGAQVPGHVTIAANRVS